MTTDGDPTALGLRLREARRQNRVTQHQAADALQMSRPTFIALEQGRRPPRPEELVSLARLYGRDVSELVRPTTPVTSLSGQFRLTSGAQDDERVDAVSDLQRLADAVVALEEQTGSARLRRYPAPYDTAGLTTDAAAEQMADAERQRLSLGDGPVRRLRNVLEDDVGVLVFALPLPSRVAGLYAFAEPAGACVAVNARHPYERQRWSLAHEYAHFLTDRHAAEVTELAPRGRAGAGERLADAFATSFLMPALGLTRRFQSVRAGRGGRSPAADLLQLAAQYQVSAEAMALRLEGLRLVGAGWWTSLKDRGLRVEDARRTTGTPSLPADTQLLPLRYRYLAVEAHLDGELSEGQLARLLRLDRTATRELVRSLVNGTDVDADGQVVEWSYEPAEHGVTTG